MVFQWRDPTSSHSGRWGRVGSRFMIRKHDSGTWHPLMLQCATSYHQQQQLQREFISGVQLVINKQQQLQQELILQLSTTTTSTPLSWLLSSFSFCFSEVIMSQQHQEHQEGQGKESGDIGFCSKDFNLVKIHILSPSSQSYNWEI